MYKNLLSLSIVQCYSVPGVFSKVSPVNPSPDLIQGGSAQTLRKGFGIRTKKNYHYAHQAMMYLWKKGTLDGFKPVHEFKDVTGGVSTSPEDAGPSHDYPTSEWLHLQKTRHHYSRLHHLTLAAMKNRRREQILEYKNAARRWGDLRQERLKLLIKTNPEYRALVFEQARGISAAAFDDHFELPPWHILRAFTKAEIEELRSAGDQPIPVPHEDLAKFKTWSYGFRKRIISQKKFFEEPDNPPADLKFYTHLFHHKIHPSTRNPPGYTPSKRFISNLEYDEHGHPVMPQVKPVEFSSRGVGKPVY